MAKKGKKDWFQDLIETGKKRGHVSLDELNSALPKTQLTPEQLNDVMYKLNEMGVEIVDSATALKRAQRAALASKTDAMFDRKIRREDVDYSGGRQDPLRVYLRKMGGVSLLSRDGEVDISRRIEKGETRARRAVLCTPFGQDGMGKILERVVKDDKKVKLIPEVAGGLQVLEGERLSILEAEARARNPRTAAAEQRRERLDQIHEESFQLLQQFKLDRKIYIELLDFFKEQAQILLRSERELAGAARRAGTTPDGLRKLVGKAKKAKTDVLVEDLRAYERMLKSVDSRTARVVAAARTRRA